jgi:hypothetical protein
VLPQHRNTYRNLILLCANHHLEIDRRAAEHTVARLKTWKAEHEAWVESATATAPREIPWTAIVQEEDCRIDMVEARRALGSFNRAVEVLELRGQPDGGKWRAAAVAQAEAVERLLASTPAERRRFAVFSLGRIPLAVHLGYVLADRARVALYQYHRDAATWTWPVGPMPREVSLAVRAGTAKNDEAAIRVSLSARVARQGTVPSAIDVEIRADDPSVHWLSAPDQLTKLSGLYEQALRRIRESGCRLIHLYYAGPAAGAIAFGRAYNPRMNPPLQLYEYHHNRRPCYDAVLRLNS